MDEDVDMELQGPVEEVGWSSKPFLVVLKVVQVVQVGQGSLVQLLGGAASLLWTFHPDPKKIEKLRQTDHKGREE